MENDKIFTNEQDIKYPSLDDIADIRVINNNIKILDENKITKNDISSFLGGVAKETTSKNIENIVNQNKDKLSAINSGISIINNKVSDINTNISNNLRGIAKEDTSKEIIKKLDDYTKNQISLPKSLFDMPNLRISSINKNSGGTKTILDVNGAGILGGAIFKPRQLYNKETAELKIEIDGKVIFDLGVTNQYGSTLTDVGRIGIFNYGVQNVTGYLPGQSEGFFSYFPVDCYRLKRTYNTSFHIEDNAEQQKIIGFMNDSVATHDYGKIITNGIYFGKNLKISILGNAYGSCNYVYCTI